MTRSLGFTSATSLVVANMIGTGVFTTSGFLLGDLGSPWAVLLVWVIGGVMATLGALSYGALARRIPESGGEYLFLTTTLHPSAGCIAGYISLLVGFSAPIAAAAYGFGEYTKTWFNLPVPVSGSLVILLFAFIHSAHIQGGARIQDFVVLIKLILILALIAFGIAKLDFPASTPAPPASISVLAVSLVWVSFSYAGWNAAVYLASEVTDPDRNLPRSLLWGTGLVALLYFGLNAVFVFSAPISDLAGKLDIGRIAGHALGGPALAEAVTALIALALITSVSSMLMAGPRVLHRMSRDGLLPAFLNSTSGPPRRAIALQAALSLIMLWSATYQSLLTYIGFTLGLSTVATVIGLIRLKLRDGAATHVPGWPWVPVLFVAGTLLITALSISQRPAESLYGFATIALGAIIWRLKHRPQPSPALPPL